MEDKKKKYAYWMRPSMVEEMESMLSEANAMSKSEFVCQAVEFYMAYLRQNKSLEFFSPLLAQTIKTEVESVERHISEMLFKVAVEQSIQNNLTAAFNEVDEDMRSGTRPTVKSCRFTMTNQKRISRWRTTRNFVTARMQSCVRQY